MHQLNISMCILSWNFAVKQCIYNTFPLPLLPRNGSLGNEVSSHICTLKNERKLSLEIKVNMSGNIVTADLVCPVVDWVWVVDFLTQTSYDRGWTPNNTLWTHMDGRGGWGHLQILFQMKSTKVLTLSSVCKQNYCNCSLDLLNIVNIFINIASYDHDMIKVLH